MKELTDVEVSTVESLRAKDYTDLEISAELLENRHREEFRRVFEELEGK